MDHFPPVSNPYDPVEVPYLGGEYDGKDFQGYPARQSLDLPKLQEGDYQRQSAAEIACFLQTWLYFGMMHGVLGISIPVVDFVRVGDSHKRLVTTHKLREYLHEWKLQVQQEKKSSSDDSLIPRNRDALTCLAHSYSFWFSLSEEQRDRFVGREIGLSIHILASTLEHALTSICDIPVISVPWRLTRSTFLTQRMLDHGWCPSVVEQICTMNHLAFQYYASLLATPSDPRQHENCRAGDAGCKVKDIVDAVYSTKHREDECKCDFISIDFDKLRAIIQRDQIPLVHLEQRGSEMTLKVVAHEKGMHYTALSHVWSDGLGNPISNALPKCQIVHLNKMVSELPQYTTYSNKDVPIDDRVWRDYLPYRQMDSRGQETDLQPLYFWIDTLCVPLNPKECRKNAIANMRSIYSRATRVLVLDAELMQSTMNSSPEEKLSRITCSTWIRRLWTLQEAALARSNYFQFAEEAAIILDGPAPAPGESPYARWYDNEVMYYSHLFNFNWWKLAPAMTELDRIYFVFHALKARSTSHLEDELICLATLLDLDLKKLLETPDEHRMKQLWTMCHQLPAAILFLPGKKLMDEKFGWAPALCMDCVNIGIPMSVPATVTPEGLHVTLPGFVLHTPPPSAKSLIACELEGNIFYIRQNVKLGSPSWEGLDLSQCSDLAVILGQNPMHDPTIRPPLVACVGALVKTTKTEKGTIFVDYVRMVSVIGKDCLIDRSPNPPCKDGVLEVFMQNGLYREATRKWSGSYLLEKGADVNVQNKYVGTALQAASNENHGQTAQLLLEKGETSKKTALPIAPRVLARRDFVSNETTDVSTPEATVDDSSESGYEVMSDGDEDVQFGDLKPSKYDTPLASLRDRISKPVEYFERLEALAHFVYEHSTLQTYSPSYSLRMTIGEQEYSEPCPRYPESLIRLVSEEIPKPLPDSDVMRICQEVSARNNAFASALLEILQCRNVNAQTYSNLRTLQFQGFCSHEFNMLAIDPSRHNVVRLLPVDIKRIQQLLEEIESVLRKIVGFAMHTPSSIASSQVLLGQALGEQDNLLLAVPCCIGFLNALGLVLGSPSVARTHLSILAVLRLVVNTLDLAVVSYAGAHLDRFDEECLGEDVPMIDVLGPFASLYNPQTPSIKLRRCQLQCLDTFHNSQSVWVFSSSNWEPHTRLLLSTKIEDFADIWGPLWKVVNPAAPNSYTRYAVGNGYIYKWKPHEATTSLLESETLCHWVSNTMIECGPEDPSSKEQLVLPDRLEEDFNGNETLLIGAVAAGSKRLASNRDCNFNISRWRSMLCENERVRMLGVVEEHTYRDSDTYQLQVGHSGMNASAARQYKRRGQFLKQAFVELWTTTPKLRDPRLLQDYYGLEISLCTHNAQRVQLGRILGFSSMCQYLSSFSWTTDGAKKAYFDSLKRFREDSNALQQSWKRHIQYREEFGQAVLVCLQALEKTGINHNGQLGVFLSSGITARPELIAMEHKEHDWIRILKDSEDSCCMAVIGDECLGFRYRGGARCGRSGRSVLRTALVVNRQNKPLGIKRKTYNHEIIGGWRERWSVRDLAVDSNLWLGTHGTLRVQSHLPDATLLMEWRASDMITRVVRSYFDKEKPHREYIEDLHQGARVLRPVPLFVMAKK